MPLGIIAENMIEHPASQKYRKSLTGPPSAKVSDGSHPPVTFDLSPSESASSRSLHHLVQRPCPSSVLGEPKFLRIPRERQPMP
jgi:hypothetical protein